VLRHIGVGLARIPFETKAQGLSVAGVICSD
jgi:hypothetical protein